MYSQAIAKELKKQGLVRPTLIQERSWPLVMAGDNLFALSKTGTGKTLAYLLPVLEKMAQQEGQAVIFEPTSELALQTNQIAQSYAQALGIKTLALAGSGSRKRQLEKLRERKPQVLIATPGRFFDLLGAKKIKAQDLQILVLDEPDDLLEFKTLSLFEDLEKRTPQAQILLFGASASQNSRQCEDLFNRTFIQLDLRNEQRLHLRHYFLQVDNRHKLDYLKRVVRLPHFKGIVFFDNNERLNQFASILAHSKLRFAVLGTSQSKQERSKARQAMLTGKVRVLLATDLAARGLDLPGLTYVVNFDLPENWSVYLHRSGRTGRMGKAGTCLTLGDDHDGRRLAALVAGHVDLKRVWFGKKSLVKKQPTARKEVPEKHKKRLRDRKNKGYHGAKWRGQKQ
jgi:superfamily II DNA/RNA helicase